VDAVSSGIDAHGDPLPAGALARAGTIRARQEGVLAPCHFLPGNRTLATCGLDGVIHLWDTATGKELRTFRGHRGNICDLTFTPDGKVMALERSAKMKLKWPRTSNK
jgi:WD40 repeat protein